MAGRIPTVNTWGTRPEKAAQPWACPTAENNEEQVRAEMKSRGSLMQNLIVPCLTSPSQPRDNEGIPQVT